ncbi:unnamed protein product [Callosobruchus maculatus]|uniref:Uncharacterized protein n=1 Tax=Callosobruchus maculatus TaxID=64391 RepID=A0A653CQA3_CALMS|nr:unnamed protein product [Callosobruchus maculatus]
MFQNTKQFQTKYKYLKNNQQNFYVHRERKIYSSRKIIQTVEQTAKKTFLPNNLFRKIINSNE